jgi:hypothetical protein
VSHYSGDGHVDISLSMMLMLSMMSMMVRMRLMVVVVMSTMCGVAGYGDVMMPTMLATWP